MNMSDRVIAVIGLGYVGLPLAVEFGKRRRVIGFDVNRARISELQAGHDHTLEVGQQELTSAQHLEFSYDPQDLAAANTYIVTVPTPIDAHNRPDLTPLRKASETVGSVLKKGDIVIYELTVYPGATEEDCVPVLEQASGLSFNTDFFCGYSPERINPGDKAHRLPDIAKVTSGSTAEVADIVDALYGSIITAGTHKAESIGYHPEIILAGRRLNDGMGAYVASEMVKASLQKRIQVNGARVLIMGLTFKENCPDLRNTRVIDLIHELRKYSITVDVHDPWVDEEEARQEYGLGLIATPETNAYDGVVIAVAHDQFRTIGATGVRKFGKSDHVLADLKYVFTADESDLRL
ncbi:MAG: nucleotide sugar dehydrogenase [Tsuneonella suprasediminis]|nr:Vi polysaccharide biosynthesis UDP-N-acetylglucosamine C-6 dehydrogenase TviB [Altererythrobacter sp. N1]